MKTQNPQGMTQYILSLVLAEFDRIDQLPPEEYHREYFDLNDRVRGMYGRPDGPVTTH